jgi:hypothetical protein
LLASLWLLVMVALWIGTSAALFGFAVGSGEVAAETYGEFIYNRYSTWQTQQQTAAANLAGVPTPNPPGTAVAVGGPGGQVVVRINPGDFAGWWKQQDQAAFLRDAGGLFGGINWIVWYIWMWAIIVSLVFGVMWATLMLARSRGQLLMWGGVIILTAAAIGLIPIMDWFAREPTWTRQAAARQIAPLVLGMTLLWAFIALSVGLWFGRSIARAMVAMLLPPRMRSSLAFLWLTDGLEPPRAMPRR